MARWRFRFWLSPLHLLCGLCTRYRGVCGNISSPMPVSFFQCLLLWSMFHMHSKKYGHGQGTHQSDLGAGGDVLVVPNDFWFGHCSSSLVCPGQYFRLGSLLRYYSSQIFKVTDGLQFLVSMVFSVLMPLVLFVINWISSVLICMPCAVEVSSR